MGKVMKVLLSVIGALFLLIVIAAGIFVVSRHVDYDVLTEVSFKRAGTIIFPSDEYKLTFEEGTWTAWHLRESYQDETVEKTIVTDEFAEQIKTLLSQNKVHWWDGFDFYNPLSYGGHKYIFYMRFSDGKEVEWSAYLLYPPHMDTVWDGMAALVEEVLGE